MLMDAFEYRASYWFWVFIQTLPIIGIYFLWSAIIPAGGSLKGYNYQAILTYYIGVTIAVRIIQSTPEWDLNWSINEGYFTYYLYRPISPYLEMLSVRIAMKIFNLMLFIPAISLIIYLLGSNIALPSLANLLLFFGFCLISFVIMFTISFTVGLIAFWWENAAAIFYFKNAIVALLSGYTIPFEFFPAKFQNFLNILPFKYVAYFPAKIFQGQLSLGEIGKGALLALLWMLILLTIMRFIYLKGLRRYSAVGG